MFGASEDWTFLPLSDVAFTHDGMEHIGRENVFAISPRCSDHHTSSRDFEQHLRMEEPHLRRKEVPGPPLMCTVNFDLVRKSRGKEVFLEFNAGSASTRVFNFFEADEQFH